MQNILYAFFIALVNNLDNISVRMAYGLKGIKIDLNMNLFISAITFIVSTLTAYFGSSLSTIISPLICNIFTMLIFVILGLGFILGPYIKHKEANKLVDIISNPDEADLNKNKKIDLKEAMFLGIALNINNIGGSFSAGMLSLNPYTIGLLSAIFSFLALWLGGYLEHVFKKAMDNKKATWIIGFILIIIGIKQLL